MQTARVETIKTQSPVYKLVTVTLKAKKVRWSPGQVVTLRIPSYGLTTLAIIANDEKLKRYELLASNTTIPEHALQQSAPGEEVAISAPKGKGIPAHHFISHDVVLITDNTGLGATLSFARYLAEREKEYGNITMFYLAPESAEILMKETLRELQKHFPVIMHAGPIMNNVTKRIEYNPLRAKTLMCVADATKNDVLDYYVKPLGISYKDVFLWHEGESALLMK